MIASPSHIVHEDERRGQHSVALTRARLSHEALVIRRRSAHISASLAHAIVVVIGVVRENPGVPRSAVILVLLSPACRVWHGSSILPLGPKPRSQCRWHVMA